MPLLLVCGSDFIGHGATSILDYWACCVTLVFRRSTSGLPSCHEHFMSAMANIVYEAARDILPWDASSSLPLKVLRSVDNSGRLHPVNLKLSFSVQVVMFV